MRFAVLLAEFVLMVTVFMVMHRPTALVTNNDLLEAIMVIGLLMITNAGFDSEVDSKVDSA